MSNDNIQREKDLFVSFQYLRLMYDLDYITEQMKKSQYSNADSRGGVIQKYTTNPIKNIARDVSAPKQNKDRELVLERINVFREKNKNNNFNLFYDNKIEEVVKEVFKFDKYNSQFYLFSIQLAIDNEYEYIY